MNTLADELKKNKDKIPVLMMHAGSGNHGCEAIVESLLDVLEQVGTPTPILVSNSVAEDRAYGPGKREKKGRLILLEERHIEAHFFAHVWYYLWRKLTGDKACFLRYRFAPLFSYLKTKGLHGKNVILYCVGGDNYCYPEMVEDLILADRVFQEKGLSTVLLGCSIEPASVGVSEEKGMRQNVATDATKALIADLNTYGRIIARESITYRALQAAGIAEEKLCLLPDPAFSLRPHREEKEKDTTEIPKGIIPRRTVGLNLSPMVVAQEGKSGMALESYRALIQHILQTSNAQVALIPHVVWSSNDDKAVLQKLYASFKDTDRVVMVEDHTAGELKAIIAMCSVFVGARTHSTIAAYSSGVPTLVIGYSVKSRGIATDLFQGTEIAQATPALPAPFVLPVQNLTDPQMLMEAYDKLLQYAGSMQEILHRKGYGKDIKRK